MNRFEIQVQQMNQQTQLHQEARYEEGNLYTLQMRERNVPLSEEGRKDARSLSIQISKWKDALSEAEQNDLFLFVSLDDSILRFKRYLLQKYTGKKQSDWERKLNERGYLIDVERMFYSKIYDHKYHLLTTGNKSAFASPFAQNHVVSLHMKKFIEAVSHEAVGRYSKVAKDNPELTQHSEAARALIQKAVNDVLEKKGFAEVGRMLGLDVNEPPKLQ